MRIASDIGGTFTDLTYLDEQTGELGVMKVATTPSSFADGVVETLQNAQIDTAGCSFFVHGSTVIINALTERKGVKTGLITTRGFRDVLEIGRANRPDIYNMTYVKPEPFVPRYLRLEAQERLTHSGRELAPLNHEDVRKAVQHFQAEGVQAIAVCFLHAYANPRHEIECGEIIRQLAPDMPVTLSHQITQEWREYERTSTAVLNSYVHPIARDYLDNLENELTGMGMAHQTLHVMQSNGGSATFESGKSSPINLVESGPVAGVIGAAHIGKMLGEPNVIALDIGGTTAKTSLIEQGNPRITTDYKIEHRRDYAGYPILVPTVDIVEIGAGGGSIAWIDKGGALRVGPVSAGADPGPASFGWGGDEPTVTDANVLAGRINPAYCLGGDIQLDVGKAQEAMQPIADAFHLSAAQAAMGVIRIANANMINALKLVSVRRGYDPRDFVLIAFGGGGAMHAGALMRELQVKKVIIPNEPAVFSSWGMLITDLRRDYIRTHITRTDRVEPGHIVATFDEMGQQAVREMAHEGVASDELLFRCFADMRYLGQEHTVKVPLPAGRFTTEMMPVLNERFHDLHQQAYAFRLETPVELVNYHVTARGLVKQPQFRKLDGRNGDLQDARKETRRVNFDELGYHEAAIYERDLLPVGQTIYGPAVVEEPASTTVVFPDQTLTRDAFGFLHIEQQSPADTRTKPTDETRS